MKNAVITIGCVGGIASRHALAIKNYELNNEEEQLSDNDNMQSLVSISYYFGIMCTKKFLRVTANFM